VTTPASTGTSSRETRHRGPSLVAVAVVFVVLSLGSLAVTAAMTGGGHFPSPFGPPAEARAFFASHTDAIRVAAFLQFGAAMPLAIFTATASSRLRFLGIDAAGATIALVGGTFAAAMAALSALAQWALAQPDLDGGTRALHLLAFAAGGPGTIAPFGLLVAGIAVTAGLSRKLPRWAMWFGLGVAAAAELSSLSIAIPAGMVLLPVARFAGFAWMLTAAAILPATRGGRGPRESAPPLRSFAAARST
jgi:hypothetical protein